MEGQQNRKNPTPEEKKREGRRKFLKFGAGLAAGLVMGEHLGERTIEVLDEHEEFNALEKRYAGREEDFHSALEVIDLLLKKMKETERKQGMKDGTLVMGILHDKRDDETTDSMKFLRDFLTKHLTSHASKKYSEGFKNNILKGGFYAKSNLILIRADIERILEKEKEKKKRYP